jgi:hypothetical protein
MAAGRDCIPGLGLPVNFVAFTDGLIKSSSHFVSNWLDFRLLQSPSWTMKRDMLAVAFARWLTDM